MAENNLPPQISKAGSPALCDLSLHHYQRLAAFIWERWGLKLRENLLGADTTLQISTCPILPHEELTVFLPSSLSEAHSSIAKHCELLSIDRHDGSPSKEEKKGQLFSGLMKAGNRQGIGSCCSFQSLVWEVLWGNNMVSVSKAVCNAHTGWLSRRKGRLTAPKAYRSKYCPFLYVFV